VATPSLLARIEYISDQTIQVLGIVVLVCFHVVWFVVGMILLFAQNHFAQADDQAQGFSIRI